MADGFSCSKIIAACIISCIAVGAPARAQTPGEPPFAGEVYVFGVEDEIYPPEACSTLFVGSSSIRYWFHLARDFGKLKIIRRGYGGSTVADTNFYFDRIVAKYQPRQIVFYAGENDLNGGKTPDELLGNIKEFMELKTASLGATPVFYISVKPSKARWSEFDTQSRANQLIADMAANREDMVFVDVASAMIENGEPKNIFIGDGLHMNHEGYAIWRQIIGRALKKEKTSKAPHCN